jgi:superkiller protein 3
LAIVGLAVGTFYLRRDNSGGPDAREARRTIDSERYAEALAPLDRWLRARPDSAEAHFLRGRALFHLDRGQEALGEFERAKDLGYPEGPLERFVGIILVRAGRLKDAEPMLERARSASNGPDPLLDEALAQLYLGTYRLGPALEVLNRWAQIAPDDPKPYLWKVEVDSRIDGGPGAIERDFQEALKRDPNLDGTRLKLAEILRIHGKNEAALPEYEAYLAKHPDDSKALAGAGLAAMDLGRKDEAIRRFDRALELDPDDVSALTGRAAIAMRDRKFDLAFPLLERAKKIDPHNPEIRYQLSLALDRLGRADEARAERAETERLRDEFAQLSEIRQALIKTPNDPELQHRAARWLIENGHVEEGLKWAQRALEAPGGHPPTAKFLSEYYASKGDTGLANFYGLQAGQPTAPARP